MDFKETLASWLRPALKPQQPGLRDALDAGRQAIFAETYDRALELLDRALESAQTAQDDAALTIAALLKVEVLIRQRRYVEADALLQLTLAAARSDTQRSYSYSMLGMLAQTRGDWAAARTAYERALDAARAAKAVGAEGRALGHLGDTYLHEDNASYAAHLLQDALPNLTSAGDVELNSYFTGLLGQAMIQNGQTSDGLRLLDRALHLAEQISYRFYERYWAAALGDRALSEGRAQDAHTYYTHVLRLFAPDTVAADYVHAVAQMSRACQGLRKADEALAYAQIALTTAEKLGDERVLQEAKGALGVALRSAGRSAEAIPYLRAVAESDQIDVLRSLAAAQSDSGDIDAAIATYQRAVRQAEAADKTLELAQARRDLGLVYQRRRDLQAAVNEWTAALAIYEEAHAYGQTARLYCDIGSARKRLGYRARAMRDYEQALMVLNSLNGDDQETRGLVLSNAANAYAEQGDADSADAFFTEAISIAERLGDRVAEATRNGNYGWFLLLVGRPRRAIATLERALAISQPLHLTLQSAVQLDNLGLVYDSLADYPAALERHRKALALMGDPALAEQAWAAQIKVNLANTLISTNSLDEAQALITDALAQARADGQGEAIIAALTAQARLGLARGPAAAADEALTEAAALARKIDHRRLMAEVLSVRSQQKAALSLHDEAAAAWEEAQRLYLMLHMPQGKTQPAWLARSATQP